MVGVTHALQRRDHPPERRRQRRRRRQPPRGIDLAQHRQQHDDVELRPGARARATPPSSCTACSIARASPSSPIWRRGSPPGISSPAAITPHHAAIRATPGGALSARAIEMPRAARERVEHQAAIDQVGRRQDQRRVRGPVEDAAAPQLGVPGRLADLFGMDGEPRAHQRLGDRRADRARRDGRQIAQPGEAVEMVAERRLPARLGEIEIGEGDALAAKASSAPRAGRCRARESPTNGSSGTAISFSGCRPRRRSAWSGVRQARRRKRSDTRSASDSPLPPPWRISRLPSSISSGAVVAHPPLNAAMLAA